MTQLREMLLHQIGQNGGKLLYPAAAERPMRIPMDVNRYGRQVLRPVLFGGYQQNPVFRFLLRSHSGAATFMRFLNVVLDQFDTDPSRLRLYQEIGRFGGDCLALWEARKMIAEAL
jgi:hypothetical protein